MTTYQSLLNMMQQVKRAPYRSDPEHDEALLDCMSYCLHTILEKLAAAEGPPRDQVEKVRRAIFNALSSEVTPNTGIILAAVYEAMGFPGIDYPPNVLQPQTV